MNTHQNAEGLIINDAVLVASYFEKDSKEAWFCRRADIEEPPFCGTILGEPWNEFEDDVAEFREHNAKYMKEQLTLAATDERNRPRTEKEMYLDMAEEKTGWLNAYSVAEFAAKLKARDLEIQNFELGFWKKDGRVRQHRQYMDPKRGTTSKFCGKNGEHHYKERVSKKRRQRGLKDK